MKIQLFNQLVSPWVAWALTLGASLCLASCADDLDNEAMQGDRGAVVAYNISNAQDGAEHPSATRAAVGAPLSRAAFSARISPMLLTPEDLTSQQLNVTGGDANTCLLETTTAGIESLPCRADEKAVAHGGNRLRIAPRANVVATFAPADHFSSTGYRGTTPVLSTTPWFYNQDTNPDGILVNKRLWSWTLPYGKFYAVYPRVIPGYTKLQLSPESYTSTPYVDFEVEPKVVNQKDLMTACSGDVKYATRYVGPTTNLNFHHALTAIRFKVGQNLSWNKTITKVEIIGAKSKGRYTLSSKADGTGATWSNLSTPATFTLGGDGTLNVSTSQAVNQIIMGNNGDNFTFYMIPQSLSGVSVKIYFSDGSTPINVNLSGTWKAGTTKTYALSQKQSTWQYQLTVTNPAAVDYTSTTAQYYTVQSYREDPMTHVQQPVKWKVVGYQESSDGGSTWSALSTTKPRWLTNLSMEEGNGSTSTEQGTATVKKDITDSLSIYNKKMQDATPKGSAGNYYNLSNATGAPTVENTANSYLISAPGYYRIPLVYGNAITGGTANPHSYKTSNSGTCILQNFKDHADQDITDPWITKSNGGANVPDGAKIVWTDASGIIEASSLTLSADKKFVQFHVPQDKIKNGNAVIAVTKGGTVVWSWHLWFDHKEVLNTIPVVNHQGVTYKFTARELGSIYFNWMGSAYNKPRVARLKVEQTVANGGVKQFAYIDITQNPGGEQDIAGVYYQFGRKDPFPSNRTVNDGSVKWDGRANTIQENIQHPERAFREESGPIDADPPAGFAYWNLWSMDNTVEGFNDNTVVKTIYDPCPVGFKMPASNAFSGFTTTGENALSEEEYNVSGNWTIGWNLKTGTSSPKTVFFVALGYMFSDGNIFPLGSGGTYWAAIPSDDDRGASFLFSEYSVNPQNTAQNITPMSVRPVAE